MEQEFETKYNKNNIRIYSLISYVGFLWIVGLLVQEKDDEFVRFHVGQGIILFIFATVASIAMGFVEGFASVGMKLSATPESVVVLVNFGISAVKIILNIVSSVFMGLGVYNACTFKKEKLPIIGNLAFYK